MAQIKEACGVFGIYHPGGEDAAGSIYYGLSSLQHRGQESCGIAVCDTAGPMGNMNVHRGMGLVNEVFREDTLRALRGNLGIGHVRYSTTGAATLNNAQPLVLNYIKGTLALAHNGNLVNTEELRQELARTGAIFQTTTDSEVIAYYIARERVHTRTVEEAIRRTADRIKGAYGLVIASPRKLIGVRDPLGLKPLCLGKLGDSYIIASESCALSALGAQFLRDVRPGEIITVSPAGISSNLELCREKQAHCIFEYIYFARLDSRLDGHAVYDARIKAGAALARSRRCRSGNRRTGFRDYSSSGIRSPIRHSLRHGILQKQLCGKDLYQAHPKRTGVCRPAEIECTGKCCKRKRSGADRRFYRPRNDHYRPDPASETVRCRKSACADQLASFFISLLLWNGCSLEQTVTGICSPCRRDLQYHWGGFPWLYEGIGSVLYGRRSASVQSMF